MLLGKRVLLLAALLLAACDPSAFTRPLQEFKAANATLREAYFQQLRIARDARQDNFAIRRMATLWVGKGDPKQVAAAIAQRASTPELNPESLKLRQAAFDALDGYAGVLLALASGEQTGEIIADVKGLASDFAKIVEAAKTLKGMGGFARDIEPWLGPLAGVADLFGTVFQLVSDAAREKALRESIVAADKPINGLLELLAAEARYANDEARNQYAAAADYIEKELPAASFNDQAARREAAEHLVRVQTRAAKLATGQEVSAVFTAAREAQAALVRKSAKPDYDALLNEIRTFKKTVTVLKENLDAIERAR